MDNRFAPGGKSSVNSVVINSMAVALVFVAAMFVHISVPVAGAGGMIHMGDLPLFIFAILYGRKTGAIAGAFGLALFDFLAGWSLWAPFTFVIGGAMGFIVGFVAEHNEEGRIIPYGFSVMAANLITISGYYIAEGLLYGNWLAPAGSVPVNFLQVTLPAVLALPIARRLKRI